ncbi:MAG: 50S ribosomal protein L9 [Candidatus Moranbacteria bacterium]|nr:50S ribosomal protein L9 [Candidatus Moranbacteria bacterium]MDD3964854.1 50S ribosomal protein L9 [Candidatus Moranbacteria bacterium]
MKVILLQDVEKLGKAGEIKEVRSGYGFNFLLPEGLAEFATPTAIKETEKMVARQKKETESMLAVSKETAGALAGKKITIKTKAENGKLFGSIGREEIALALEAAGTKIDAKHIVLEKGFKEVGVFTVEAHFGHGVKASFEVTIKSE